MKKTLAAALCAWCALGYAQTTNELGDIAANLERAIEIIAQAGREDSGLVVFPELYLTGYALGQVYLFKVGSGGGQS